MRRRQGKEEGQEEFALVSRTLAARLAGALFFVGGLVMLLPTLVSSPPHSDALAGLGVSALAVGVASWLVPWKRWPQRASLGLVLFALLLVAVHAQLIGGDLLAYGLVLVLVFVWSGLVEGRWMGLKLAPLAACSYILPLSLKGAQSPVLIRAVLLLALAVILGEGTAWIMTRSNQLIRERERWFRSLVHNAFDLIAVADAEGKIIYENPGAEAVFGRPRQDLAGHSLLDLVHPLDRGRIAEDFGSFLSQQGETRNVASFRILQEGGEEKWVQGRAINLIHDPAVRGIVLNFRDVSEERKLEEQLAYQALHDPVTNLPNRALLRERIAHALELAPLSGTRVALVAIDPEQSRQVNEQLGVIGGDALLAEIAQRLQSHLRPGDTLARLSGDVFAVVVHDVMATDDALALAHRLIAELKEPLLSAGARVQVDARASVAVAREDGGPDHLITSAEAALAVGKISGEEVTLFDPRMLARLNANASLQEELAAGLERDEIEVHFQPIYNLNSGSVVGMEALARWRHPRRGLLPPAEFIPLAESGGLIVPLGEVILEQACRGVSSLGDSVFVSVNLSPRQLRQKELGDVVERALASARLDPSRLVVELTESVMIEDLGVARRVFTQLRNLGVRVAIDDFGTGYATLSHLRQLPVDMVKLDRSFVSGLGRDREAEALTEAMVRLAQGLGIEMVAEGIENDTQLARLRALGCAYGQGFLLAKPVPLVEARPFVEERRRTPARRRR